jgi:hypothetical protein
VAFLHELANGGSGFLLLAQEGVALCLESLPAVVKGDNLLHDGAGIEVLNGESPDYKIRRLAQKFQRKHLLVLEGKYGNVRFVFPLAGELDGAVDEGVKSVVLTHAHVEARVVSGTPLTDDDVAGLYDFLAELLDSEPFGMRLTTVLGTGLTFFVCHNLFS